jgi:MFS family permease
VPRQALLAIGCAVMLAADLVLAFAHGIAGVFAGIALWGVHMGLTEGLISALTADHAPPALRGTAFGIVNLARAAMLLPASALAGALWSGAGPAATFVTGAAIATVAGLAALALQRPVAPGANAAA